MDRRIKYHDFSVPPGAIKPVLQLLEALDNPNLKAAMLKVLNK